MLLIKVVAGVGLAIVFDRLTGGLAGRVALLLAGVGWIIILSRKRA